MESGVEVVPLAAHFNATQSVATFHSAFRIPHSHSALEAKLLRFQHDRVGDGGYASALLNGCRREQGTGGHKENSF